jgi:hypothetical protein
MNHKPKINMKPKLKFIVWVSFATFIMCAGCRKESTGNTTTTPQPSTPPSTPPPGVDSTLIGKEFTFSSTWQLWTDALGDMIYVSIDPQNSFSIASLSYLKTQASIQLNASSLWMDIPYWNWYNNNTPFSSPNTFRWYFAHWPYHDNANFLIENYPYNYQLIGQPVKVKVKFI